MRIMQLRSSSTVFVTVLRHPVQRAVSSYFFEGRWKQKDKTRSEADAVPLLTWIEKLSAERTRSRRGSIWQEVSNYYTQILSGRRHHEPVSVQSAMDDETWMGDFKTAKQNIESFDYVLITEWLDSKEQWKWLLGRLGGTTERFEMELRLQKGDQSSRTKSAMNDTELRLLQDLNKWDLMLYDHSKKVSEAAMEKFPADTSHSKRHAGCKPCDLNGTVSDDRGWGERRDLKKCGILLRSAGRRLSLASHRPLGFLHVISIYHQDLRWTSNLLGPHVFFRKDTPDFEPFNDVNICGAELNVLKFIIDFYDSLPTLMVFTHPYNRKWTHHGDLSKLVNDLYRKQDQLGTFGPVDPRVPRYEPGQECIKKFRERRKAQIQAKERGVRLRNISEPLLCDGLVNYAVIKKSGWYESTMEPYFGPMQESYAAGNMGTAQFFVRAEAVRRLPLSFYQQMHKYLVRRSTGDLHKRSSDPNSEYYVSRFMEWSWEFIFTAPLSRGTDQDPQRGQRSLVLDGHKKPDRRPLV